ncbi:MAG: hypothetical protein RQ741_05455 [Wenzhouxiangellaceae bacterium]|nr:hypothetical protein [Wenzhouxiangellaceae bacterium]
MPRRYLGVLQSLDDVLLMITLRFAHPLIAPERIQVKRSELSEQELKTARSLIDELSGSFEISDYQDDCQQKLMRLIKQKAHGEKPDMKRPRRRKPTTPEELQAALEKSLAQANKSRAGKS